MNQTSPVATGAAGAITGGIVAALGVANTHWNLGITPQEQFSLSVGIVTVGHWLIQKWIELRSNDAAKMDMTPV
jgi:hypothetical protein